MPVKENEDVVQGMHVMNSNSLTEISKDLSWVPTLLLQSNRHNDTNTVSIPLYL